MSWLLVPLAGLLGAVLTTQIATNTELGKALGNPYIPAAANMASGLIITAILTWAMTPEWPSREVMRGAPWYLWAAGGVLGVTYLTGNILLAPKLGAGALVALSWPGSLYSRFCSTISGGSDLRNTPPGVARLAGCCLMIAGVFLVSRF